MTRSLPDLAALLEPIQDGHPCGPELDYDGDFIALEQLMLGSPERQYGDTIIAAEGPDFSEVSRNAIALLGRSKDLRLAVMATRGLTRTAGAAGARSGLELLINLIENYWDGLHPLLLVDGDEDPLPRANALASLAAKEGLLGDLRALRLNTRLLGTVEIVELERAALGREGASLTRAQLHQLLQDESLAGNSELAALNTLLPLVRRLDSELRQRLGVVNAPDFKPLLGLLDALEQPHLAGDSGAGSEDSVDAEQAAFGGESGLPALRTRQDAIAILEAVCLFLERHEPANPAPLLIRRARGLIGQDFLSILRELAPEGVSQAEHIAGVRS